LFGLGINAETVVDTNISDMPTIKNNVISKSHSIEEKEIKNLENLLSKYDVHSLTFDRHGNNPRSILQQHFLTLNSIVIYIYNKDHN
jgi:hypothetical protein